MAQTESSKLTLAEFDLRRYEARIGFWKVVFGTFIVGIAGVIIPGAISFTTLLFEDWRAEARLELETRAAHQQYIKDFFDTAVTQDIELRIRFAQYFSSLSDQGGTETLDPETEDPWRGYLSLLIGQRTDIRNRINDLEAQLVTLQSAERTESKVIQLDRVSRELQWAYNEIGYVPLDRSPVQVVSGKKERLYSETLDIVRKLATNETAIDPTTQEYKRFWELYERDLIPVESIAVEMRMVALGRELGRLASSSQPPGEEFVRLWQDLEQAMRSELIRLAQDKTGVGNASLDRQNLSILSDALRQQPSGPLFTTIQNIQQQLDRDLQQQQINQGN